MPLANLLDRVPEVVGSVCGGGGSGGNGTGSVAFTRMETISMEERHGNPNTTWQHIEGGGDHRRVPTLRDSIKSRQSNNQNSGRNYMQQRYFPLLCLAQTILIFAILFYLYYFRSIESQEHSQASELAKLVDPKLVASLSKYRVYTNGSIKARFLLDPPSGCNQRKHDLHFGSRKCVSKDAATCERVTSGIEERFEIIGSDSDTVQIITTSKAGKRLFSKWVTLQEVAECQSQQECSIDSRTKLLIESVIKQSIIGWGGALTDSSINNILSLSTNGTMRLLDDYYGADGLQFNIARITIGGSDFSARFYTNNDKRSEEEPDDLAMKNFQLAPEDTLYKIPILKYIQAKYGAKHADGHGIKLFASMWSPPTWMKTNNHFNKGYLKGAISMTGSANTDERYYKALAELKKLFLLAYQRQSIKFWGMTVMNEPVFAKQPFLDFNTMIFPEHDYANYVAKYLGPTLKEHPELGHIRLMAHDDNRRFLINFTEPTLRGEISGPFIDGVSVHGYADKDYWQMDKIWELNRHKKDFFVLPTELCSGHLPWMQKALAGNWHRGVHYALDIIHSLQNSAAGWVDWNMALDMEGGPGWLGGRLDSPILVDKDQDLYYRSPMFYVLGQFSRYIPVGSVRISSRLINGVHNYPLETVTFRSSVKQKGVYWFVTVVLNANPHPVTIHLKPAPLDKLFKVECEPDSLTTIRYSSLLGVELKR